MTNTAIHKITKLHQCPFCKSKNLQIRKEEMFLGNAWVECNHCQSRGPFGYSLENARQKWNNRAAKTERKENE